MLSTEQTITRTPPFQGIMQSVSGQRQLSGKKEGEGSKVYMYNRHILFKQIDPFVLKYYCIHSSIFFKGSVGQSGLEEDEEIPEVKKTKSRQVEEGTNDLSAVIASFSSPLQRFPIQILGNNQVVNDNLH